MLSYAKLSARFSVYADLSGHRGREWYRVGNQGLEREGSREKIGRKGVRREEKGWKGYRG